MLGMAILVDFIWFFYISLKSIWKSDSYENLAGWETKPHTFARWMGVVTFVVKVRVISKNCEGNSNGFLRLCVWLYWFIQRLSSPMRETGKCKNVIKIVLGIQRDFDGLRLGFF